MNRPDAKSSFASAVKAGRSRLGISQEELAGRAGLHRTYISDIERGARNVSLESIEKLAKALESSISALFGATHELLAKQSEIPGWVEPVQEMDILLVEDDPYDIE